VPAVPQEAGDPCPQGDRASSTATAMPVGIRTASACICTMEDVSARSKLRHLLVRGQLQASIITVLSHLPENIQGQVTNAFFIERLGTYTEG